MITLEEAIDIYLKKSKAKYIASIYEIESSYVFAEILESGEYPCTGGTYAVRKDTGETWVFFLPHHIEEWKAGKELEVPEKYRFHGEIKP